MSGVRALPVTQLPGSSQAVQTTPPPLTVEEFLAAIFPNAAGAIWTCEIEGDPGRPKSSQWGGRAFDPQLQFRQTTNWYFSIGELKAGATARKAGTFHALRVVVLDDIGTGLGAKVNPNQIPLPPTYRIETSPGNEQWGFALDSPLLDKAKATRLLDGIAGVGATDKGGMNLVRYMRLPGGINGKKKYGSEPFRVHVVVWAPERRYTPDRVALAFGVDLEGKPGRPRNQLPNLPPSDDPLLRFMVELGMVVDPNPNTRGFVDILCPWRLEHSGGTELAGYVPGGTFKCFHGHCANRRTTDLIAYLRDRESDLELIDAAPNVTLKEALEALPGPRGGLLRSLVRFAYALDVDAFVDRVTGELHPAPALDRYLANVMPGYKPTKFMLESNDLLRVTAAEYRPGRPEIIETDERGHRTLSINTWRAGPIAPARRVDLELVQPYLDHVAWLFPDAMERAIVFDFLTHLVKRRGVKINWMLVAFSQEQGAGRDTMLKPIRDILGVKNVRTIGVEDLHGQFNEFELAELVCFSEAHSSDHNKWATYRALKPKVSKPPDTVSINIKHVRAREHPKVANWIMLTNDPGAVAMDREDRRICVVETPHRAEEVLRYTETKVFVKLHALFADRMWMENFHAFLLAREISGNFDAPGRAPVTQAKSRMAGTARSSLEVAVDEMMTSAQGPFASDLVKLAHLAPALLAIGEQSRSQHALVMALRRAGAEPVRDFRDLEGDVVKGVWALRDVPRYQAMSPGALKEAWEKSCSRRT